MDFGNILAAAAEATGVSVEVRSAHLPWFDLTPTGAEPKKPSGEPAASSGGFNFGRWFLGWLKPQVIVRSDFGTFDKAPHGAPTGTTWPWVPLVALGVVALLLVFAVIGIVSLVRRG